MAFVYRAERKLDSDKPITNVGPGYYETEKVEESAIPKAYVPFNSMEPRIKPPKIKDPTPGPGAYNIAKKNDQQKVVVENATEDIKILEITKPNAMFKSGTKRFVETINSGPGPADYIYQKPKSIKKPVNTQTNRPKIIEHLIKINKYQSIPSIPSNVHAYGYYENQESQLQLNEPPVDITTGKKNDTVGPGQYNTHQQSQKVAGKSWKDDKTIKLPAFKTNPNIGPGSYEIRDGVPLYNYKPMGSFVSNTVRTGQVQKPPTNNKSNWTDRANNLTSESRVMSEKGGVQSTHIDSDDEYEYIDDSTPGPGSYINLDTIGIKSRKPAKSLHFGSTTKRFNDLPVVKNTIIGPGQYNIQVSKRSMSYHTKKSAPFASNMKRFIKQSHKNMPGPGSYEPRNALQDELIFKIQRGYRGQFGSTQQRFKQQKQIVDIGPGSYDVPASGVIPTQIPTYGTSSFKNKVTKQSSYKNQNPPPGSYNIDYFDISKKIIKQQDDDPDLIIKKPGFNTGAQRFKKPIVEQDLFQDEDFLNEIHTKVQQEQKRNRINAAPFNSKQTRLVQNKKDIPGPGQYQINNDEWNKRTYNILFADI